MSKEYGPFGEAIRSTGPMAKANPFRFSTKYQDDESDLLYYGYRYYKASTGAWLDRDPEEESGGLNLYGFVNNIPINRFDRFGLDCGGAACGPDITSALDRTMENVNWLFKNWDSSLAYKACRRLHDFGGGGFGKAWDIKFLYQLGTKKELGNGQCARTVTYKGHCYAAGAANYELCGRASCLCDDRFGQFGLNPEWSIESTIALTYAYFWYRDYPMDVIQMEKIGFTIHGFGGPTPFPWHSQCGANSTPIQYYAFQWR